MLRRSFNELVHLSCSFVSVITRALRLLLLEHLGTPAGLERPLPSVGRFAPSRRAGSSFSNTRGFVLFRLLPCLLLPRLSPVVQPWFVVRPRCCRLPCGPRECPGHLRTCTFASQGPVASVASLAVASSVSCCFSGVLRSGAATPGVLQRTSQLVSVVELGLLFRG